MKRIIVLLTVVALMMVMLAMSIAPAFARGPPVLGVNTRRLFGVRAHTCASPSGGGRLTTTPGHQW